MASTNSVKFRGYRKRLLEEAIKIISLNFGDSIGEAYAEHYEKKDSKYIRHSLENLLVDLVGPKNAAKQMAKLKENLRRDANATSM